MKKKSGTILAVVLGVFAFIGALAVAAYLFRDKLRALCGCKEDEDCDDYCDPDYFEIYDDDADDDVTEAAADDEAEETEEEADTEEEPSEE